MTIPYAQPGPLTDTAFVKSALHISPLNTSQDDWIETLRLAAETEIRSYCNQQFTASNYVEIYDGTSQKTLYLNQKPLRAINNIWVDFDAAYGTAPTAFPTSTLLTQGVDYAPWLDQTPPWQSTPISYKSVVLRLRTIWAEVAREYFPGKLSAESGPAFGVIKVDYDAGYPEGYIPADLQLAVAMLVSVWRRILPLGGWVISEKIGEYMYKLEMLKHKPGEYPEIGTLFAILNKYKDFSW